MRTVRQMLNIATARDKKRSTICSAIRQMRTIEFYYHGGYRTVEPFALGIVMEGDADNESLICYQTDGYSELLEVVGWKLYRESEIEDMVILRENFTGDRPGYDPDEVGMSRIICCVKPVKIAGEAVAPPPKVEPLVAEEAPTVVETPPVPETIPQPVIRYITHNELMERFRYAHPMPIPELYTTLWPEPLTIPFPERVEPKIWPTTPVLGSTQLSAGSGGLIFGTITFPHHVLPHLSLTNCPPLAAHSPLGGAGLDSRFRGNDKGETDYPSP